jgi:4-amino-4-deoxy-L-arabinose transferase-like glycosyltransferase
VRRGAIAIILFTLAVQLLLVWRLPIVHPAETKSTDQRHYHTYGLRITAGEDYFTFGYRPPLYPYFLGTLYSLHITSPSAVRALQVLGHLALCLAMFAVVRQVLGPTAALVSTFVLGFYPGLIGQNLLILSDSLYILFSTLGFLLAISLLHQAGTDLKRRCVVALSSLVGAAFACAYMTRSLGILLLGAFCLALLVWKPRRYLLMGICATVAFMLAVMPMLLRVHQARGYWGSPERYFWIALYVGNNGSNRVVSVWKGTKEDPALQKMWADCGYNRAFMGGCNEMFRAAVLDQYHRRPGLAVLRLVGKTIDLWGPERSVAGDVRDGIFGPANAFWVAVVLILANVFYGSSLVLGGIGMWVSRRKGAVTGFPVAIVLITTAALAILVYGHPRYHKPLVPIFIFFLWPGIQHLRATLGRKFRGAVAGTARV